MDLFGYNLEKKESKFVKDLYKITKTGFDSRMKGDHLDLYAHIGYSKMNIKDMFAVVTVYKNRAIFFDVELGKIQKTPEILKIINEYNSEMLGFLTLSIDEDNGLSFNYVVKTSCSISFKKHASFFFDSIVQKRGTEILRKLIPNIKPLD